MTPMVTVFRHPRVMGWPDTGGRAQRQDDRGYVVTLTTALTREFTTDAHFVQYASPIGRRMNSASLGGELSMRIDVIVLDLDCAETHGTAAPVPDSWRAETRERAAALFSSHHGGVYYETRGGSRIIYRLPLPAIIATADDARSWRQDYAITAAYMWREFGLDCDYACSDWTRFFRCPRATRDAAAGPEDRLRSGSIEDMDALWFTPTDDDFELAKSKAPNAFDVPRKHVAPAGEPATAVGNGLLYRMLSARGSVIRACRGGWIVRCPNEANHSSGRTGDTSTVLYPPGPGQTIGAIHCKHGHCAHLTVRDWLAMFSAHERG